MVREQGLSPGSANVVASFAEKLITRTASNREYNEAQQGAVGGRMSITGRESVMVRDQEMVIPRSQAYSCKLFEVVQAVEYRRSPMLEDVGHPDAESSAPRIGSLVWANHVVTHFRPDGCHIDMIQSAGGWLPLCVEDQVMLQPAEAGMDSTLYKVVFEGGVALRCSSDFNDRMP